MASNYKYILVRWSSGKDAGQMTVIELDWVRGNDLIVFNGEGKPVFEDGRDQSVVVEWRIEKKNKDTQQWSKYNADIIRASGNFIPLILRTHIRER